MDQELVFKYFRMNSQRFDQLLLLLIKSKIDHNYTHQIPISAAERLEITLRILATGDSQQTLAISLALAIANQYAGAGARAKYGLAFRFRCANNERELQTSMIDDEMVLTI